jgi:hypothetical protein
VTANFVPQTFPALPITRHAAASIRAAALMKSLSSSSAT